jgi:hypothetical protein
VPEQIVVSVDDEYLGQIDEVVARLQAAGMQVEQVLRPVGVITGSVDHPCRPLLDAVTGVAAVEPQRAFRLPPPDADIQ